MKPTTDQPSGDTVEKIQKLLALSKDNRNDNEREQAMAKAKALLDKYNLDMSTVESWQKQGPSLHIYQNIDCNEPWMRQIWEACADLYHTVLVWQKKDSMRCPGVIGRPENIQVTVEVAYWITHEIRSESIKLATAKQRIGFREGATSMILYRIDDLIQKDRMKQATGQNQLMVVQDKLKKENQKALDALQTDVVTLPDRHEVVDGMSLLMGQMYGNRMNLQPKKRIQG